MLVQSVAQLRLHERCQSRRLHAGASRSSPWDIDCSLGTVFLRQAHDLGVHSRIRPLRPSTSGPGCSRRDRKFAFAVGWLHALVPARAGVKAPPREFELGFGPHATKQQQTKGPGAERLPASPGTTPTRLRTKAEDRLITDQPILGVVLTTAPNSFLAGASQACWKQKRLAPSSGARHQC